MAHSIILLNTAIDGIKGNATNGPLVLLRANVNAADYYVDQHKEGGSPQNELHESLENIQAVIVDGGNLGAGIADAVAAWNTELENLLP